MKKLILVLCFLLLSGSVQAAGYVVEKSANSVGNLLGLVIDTTNEASALTTYYYLPVVADGWTAFSAQHKILAVTVTYEGSNDLLKIADADATWTDITSMLTDGTASSFTSTGSLTVNDRIPWSRLRIKRVTTNAANELEVRVTKTIVR